MAAGDIYHLGIIFANTVSGENCSINLHGTQVGLVAPSMAALGDDVKDWWDVGSSGVSAQKADHPASISLDEVTLRRVKPLEPVEQTYNTGLPIAGTDVADPVSPQVAVLVSLRTANIGRSYRGRVYLPPITESDIPAAGDMTVAFAEKIRDNFQGLLDLLEADDFRPSVYSRVLDIATAIGGIRVDRKLRTQRRRTDRSPSYV